MTTTLQTPANLTDIEEASTARWLARRLDAARARVQREPSEEAVERIRARVFGDAAPRRKERRIAA